MKKKLVAALLAVCVSASASADVIYNWTTVESSFDKLPVEPRLSLVFSDEAVSAGHTTFKVNGWQGIRDSSLLELHFSAGPYASIDYINGKVFGPGDSGTLSGDVNFTSDGFLTGSFLANNQNIDFKVASVGNLFTFERIASDGFLGASCPMYRQDCHGASGYFQKATSYSVPEPGSIALMLAGIMGLAGFAYRKTI